MKTSPIERFHNRFFPKRILLLIGVFVLVAIIIRPDIFDGHRSLLLWIAIPYTLYNFFMFAYLKGRIDSNTKEGVDS